MYCSGPETAELRTDHNANDKPVRMYSCKMRSTTRPRPGQSSADEQYDNARPYSFFSTNVRAAICARGGDK